MGFWSGLFAIGLTGYAIKKVRSSTQEEKQRKSIPCDFEDEITEEEFREIAKKCAYSVKRVKNVVFDGAIVYIGVRSQSGISDWYFSVDFNDYGHITGIYWLRSDNADSQIPKTIADRISTAIIDYIE